MNKAFLAPAVVFIMAAMSRLAFIGIPNFTPIVAMALVGGVYLNRKIGFLIPLVSLLLGDLVLAIVFKNLYHDYLFSKNMLFVYVALFGCYTIGYYNRKAIHIISLSSPFAAIAASVLFFLITNFGAWLSSPFYAKTIHGLGQCYIAGLAFFDGAIYGNFFLNLLIISLMISSGTSFEKPNEFLSILFPKSKKSLFSCFLKYRFIDD